MLTHLTTSYMTMFMKISSCTTITNGYGSIQTWPYIVDKLAVSYSGQKINRSWRAILCMTVDAAYIRAAYICDSPCTQTSSMITRGSDINIRHNILLLHRLQIARQRQRLSIEPTLLRVQLTSLATQSRSRIIASSNRHEALCCIIYLLETYSLSSTLH